MLKNIVALLLVCAFTISCNKDITTITPPIAEMAEGAVQKSHAAFNKKLMAVAKLNASSQCTATYIQVPNMQLNKPAVMVSNGHCFSEVRDDNAIETNRILQEGNVVFNAFADSKVVDYISIKATKLLYSTMKGTDISVFEINKTNQEMKALGIEPLAIATEIPALGTEMQAFGMPIKYEPTVMRLSKGKQGIKTNLAEFIWLWNAIYANTFKDISGGSSGSAVFADINKGIWGIINTTTIDGTGDCELGSPCEFGKSISPITKANTSYALPINILNGCFTNGVFDLNQSNCKLDKPSNFKIYIENYKRNIGKKKAETGKLNFVMENGSNATIKIRKFEEYAENDVAGFEPVKGNLASFEYPKAEGFYVATAINNNTQYNVTFKLDYTPPSLDLIKISSNFNADILSVDPIYFYPEVVGYKWATCGKCECNTIENYAIYNRQSINVNASELPLNFCVIGLDLSGNETIPKKFELKKP